MRDFDGAHDGSQLRRFLQRPALRQAMKQAATIRIATTRRVDDRSCASAGNLDDLAVFVDTRAVCAECDNQTAYAFRKGLDRQTGLVADELGFVVVDRAIRRLFEAAEQ